MPGPKSTSYFVFKGASESIAIAIMDHDAKKISDAQLQNAAIDSLHQLIAGTRDAFQEIYERIERLHQKLDRVEKKIGSV